jgi:hypothetical protein
MFDIRAQQSSLFPIELANDNVDPKRCAAGAPDFERLREIFHDGGIEGFAAAALLTDQRDRLTEIRIDGMPLHCCTFYIAVIAVPLYSSPMQGGPVRSSQDDCFSKSPMYLSVTQRTTLSGKGLQRGVRLQQRVQASACSNHLISVAGEPGMHPLWSIEEG